MVAAGLGVFSSQTMVDLYSAIYDSTDPGDLPDSDAWQLRQAFAGKDADTRLAAIRKLIGFGKDGLQKEAARALVARAATLVEPDAKLAKDAPDLISAMLAGGYDQAAARWIPAVNGMDDEDSDRCWAMLALAAPNVADVGTSRINSFIRRDKSRDHVRSALLVAGLAGLGRISTDTRKQHQPALRPGTWARHQLDEDDRRRCGARARGHRAGADRHRFSDTTL